MRGISMGGVKFEGCISLCIVAVFIIVGLAIAYQGASTNNSMVMLLGIIVALGVFALAGGGYLKFSI